MQIRPGQPPARALYAVSRHGALPAAVSEWDKYRWLKQQVVVGSVAAVVRALIDAARAQRPSVDSDPLIRYLKEDTAVHGEGLSVVGRSTATCTAVEAVFIDTGALIVLRNSAERELRVASEASSRMSRRHVASFMDAAGIGLPAALIGHSSGGRAAIAMAAAQPRRVSRMILIDSAGIKPRRGFAYYRKVAMAKVGKHAARLLGAPGRKLRDLLVGRAASADYAAASPRMRPTLVRLVNSDLRDLMPQVKALTLLIWGDRGTATPLDDARQMERLIPDAGLVVFEGAGHFNYLDQPARFAKIAQHFIGEGRGA